MSKEIPMRIKSLLSGIACWVIIIAIMYVFIERYLLWPLTTLMPVSSQFALGDTGYPLLQYSKKELIPKNYILITGDSYAYGVGEHLYDNIKQKRLQYHAGHTLNAITSKDVIALGFPHIGNIDSTAIIPTTFAEKIKKKYGYAIEDPEYILVYFYEGNDLANNIEDVEYRHQDFDYRAGAADNDNRFLDHLRKITFSEVATTEIRAAPLLAEFFGGIIYLSDFFHPPRRIYGPDTPGPTNKIIQNGKVVAIPDRLEAMGMFLSDEQFLLGAFVFKNSLKILQERYPKSKIGVIYIPSALSSYEIASPEVAVFVHTMTRQAEVIYPTSHVYQTSNKTCEAIHQIAQAQQVGFVDARSYFRELTKTTQLHGSKDWNHPNKAGYIALGEITYTLVQQLNSGKPPSSCENN